MSEGTHPIIGWVYSAWDGNIYRCTRWMRNQGFWMRVIGRRKDVTYESPRKTGEEVCVSERAISRTYHVQRDHKPVAHEKPCECSLCQSPASPS